MNKLLRAFATQAKIEFGKDSYGVYASLPENGDSIPALEKFAELAIRECISYTLADVDDDSEYEQRKSDALRHFGFKS